MFTLNINSIAAAAAGAAAAGPTAAPAALLQLGLFVKNITYFIYITHTHIYLSIHNRHKKNTTLL